MEINGVFEAYVMLVAMIVYLVTFIIQLRHYLKTRYVASFYWAGFNFACVMFYGFMFLSDLLLSDALLRIGVLFFIPFTFMLGGFVDTLQKDQIDMRKLLIFGVLAGAMIICSLLPDASTRTVNFMGDTVMAWGGWYRLVGTISNLIALLILISFVVHATRQTRQFPHLKTPARLLIISIIAYLSSIILGGLAVMGYQFGQIAAVAIIAYTYYYYPKLYYLLPFKVIRLIVINTENGTPVFTYTWKSGESAIDESLFSGMVQAIGGIMKESLNRGDVQEVKLAQGVLILQSNNQYPISCVLASTRSSKILRDSLSNFHKQFIAQHEKHFSSMMDVSKFQSATTLVESCFSFIPE